LEFGVPGEEEEEGGDGKEKEEKRRGNNGADSEEETVKYDVPHKPPCFYWINCGKYRFCFAFQFLERWDSQDDEI
jgi:hypothetical protein